MINNYNVIELIFYIFHLYSSYIQYFYMRNIGPFLLSLNIIGEKFNIKMNKNIKISAESIFKYISKGQIFCMFKYCILEVGLKKYDHFLYF